jgi:MFS family permease
VVGADAPSGTDADSGNFDPQPVDPDDEPSVRYVVASLVVGVFFGGVGGGVAFPTLPTLGPLLGISPLFVGVILSVNRFTRLVLNTPAGQVLDTMGTRRPMIAGFVVQGLVPFGYVLGLDPGPIPLDSATVFLLSRAAWGVGSAFVFVGAFSTVTHITTDENRGKWVGYMRGGQSLGFPAGLVVGGLVTDAYGYAHAFAVAGLAGLFAATVASFVLPDVRADAPTTSRLRDLPAVVVADVRIFAVGSVNFAVCFLFSGVLLSTVVLYTAENGIAFGSFSESGVSGVVMAASVVASSAATIAVGRFSDRLSNRALVALPALALLGAGFGVLGTASAALGGAVGFGPSALATVVGVALVGVGVGGTNPPLLAYLGDISPAGDVGKLGGVYNVFGDFGSTLGPLVALPLAARFPVAVQYVGCVGLVALAGLLVATTLFDRGPLTRGTTASTRR